MTPKEPAKDDGTIPVRVLADHLNVRPQMIWDFVRAGHLTALNGRITKESVDDLRWRIALAKASNIAIEGEL